VQVDIRAHEGDRQEPLPCRALPMQVERSWCLHHDYISFRLSGTVPLPPRFPERILHCVCSKIQPASPAPKSAQARGKLQNHLLFTKWVPYVKRASSAKQNSAVMKSGRKKIPEVWILSPARQSQVQRWQTDWLTVEPVGFSPQVWSSFQLWVVFPYVPIGTTLVARFPACPSLFFWPLPPLCN